MDQPDASGLFNNPRGFLPVPADQGTTTVSLDRWRRRAEELITSQPYAVLLIALVAGYAGARFIRS